MFVWWCLLSVVRRISDVRPHPYVVSLIISFYFQYIPLFQMTSLHVYSDWARELCTKLWFVATVLWACLPRHWMKSPPSKSQTKKSWGVEETLHFCLLERSSSLKSQALRTFGRLALTVHMLCCNKPLANIILLRFSMSSHRHTHVHRCTQIRGV